MAEIWDSYRVQCPFYRVHEGRQIRCESLFDVGERNGSTASIFRSEKRMHEHMERYCRNDYESCKLCKALYKIKYTEK